MISAVNALLGFLFDFGRVLAGVAKLMCFTIDGFTGFGIGNSPPVLPRLSEVFDGAEVSKSLCKFLSLGLRHRFRDF